MYSEWPGGIKKPRCMSSLSGCLGYRPGLHGQLESHVYTYLYATFWFPGRNNSITPMCISRSSGRGLSSVVSTYRILMPLTCSAGKKYYREPQGLGGNLSQCRVTREHWYFMLYCLLEKISEVLVVWTPKRFQTYYSQGHFSWRPWCFAVRCSKHHAVYGLPA